MPCNCNLVFVDYRTNILKKINVLLKKNEYGNIFVKIKMFNNFEGIYNINYFYQLNLLNIPEKLFLSTSITVIRRFYSFTYKLSPTSFNLLRKHDNCKLPWKRFATKLHSPAMISLLLHDCEFIRTSYSVFRSSKFKLIAIRKQFKYNSREYI